MFSKYAEAKIKACAIVWGRLRVSLSGSRGAFTVKVPNTSKKNVYD